MRNLRSFALVTICLTAAFFVACQNSPNPGINKLPRGAESKQKPQNEKQEAASLVRSDKLIPVQDGSVLQDAAFVLNEIETAHETLQMAVSATSLDFHMKHLFQADGKKSCVHKEPLENKDFRLIYEKCVLAKDGSTIELSGQSEFAHKNLEIPDLQITSTLEMKVKASEGEKKFCLDRTLAIRKEAPEALPYNVTVQHSGKACSDQKAEKDALSWELKLELGFLQEISTTNEVLSFKAQLGSSSLLEVSGKGARKLAFSHAGQDLTFKFCQNQWIPEGTLKVAQQATEIESASSELKMSEGNLKLEGLEPLLYGRCEPR